MSKKVFSIGMKYFKSMDIEQYLKKKRNFKCANQTISLPIELFNHINVKNRSKHIASIINKYRFLLSNSSNEIFNTLDNFIEFFIHLDYFLFVNDLKFNVNSKTEIGKFEVKNGFIAEFFNGIEYLNEYDNGILISKRKIKKV